VAVAAEVISRVGPTIVFSRTKHGADRIARQLGNAGVAAAAIHGDRSQSQRERALRSFHEGAVQALVATDVAARGIHVDGVECVIHFDPPQDEKDYVHRSGRTARGGASGVVVTFVTSEKRKDVNRLQRDLGYAVGLDAPAPGSLDATGGGGRSQSRSSERPVGRPSVPRVAELPGADRAPSPDGKHRPSGASRRKAKRLSDDQPGAEAGRSSWDGPKGSHTRNGSGAGGARRGSGPARPSRGSAPAKGRGTGSKPGSPSSHRAGSKSPRRGR